MRNAITIVRDIELSGERGCQLGADYVAWRYRSNLELWRIDPESKDERGDHVSTHETAAGLMLAWLDLQDSTDG